MTATADYFDYLRKRSTAGLIYRKMWLYRRLQIHLRGTVLDVGCGIGDMLRHLGHRAVGVDINPAIVDWCRGHGLDCRLMQPDILPFPDASFDSVILDNVLEHIEEPQPLLAEISRITRPSGRLIVGVPGVKGYQSDPDHKVFYNRESMVECMDAAGYQTITLFNTPFKSDWLNRNLAPYCLYGVFERG